MIRKLISRGTRALGRLSDPRYPLSLVALLAAFGAPAVAQVGSQTYPQKQYYASDYGVWQIKGQTANSYTFQPGTLCQVPAPTSGTFYPFNTNATVYIQDATPTLSELVSVSATTNTNALCSITVAAVNNHYSFNLMSGTAGLQEVLNQISSLNAYPTIVWLDRNWYSAINSIPSTSAAAVIAAVTGNSAATLVDDTTSPFTFYSWNGAQYTQSGANPAVSFNGRVSSYTGISSPTALSTAAATYGILTTAQTGGTLPASTTYRLGITYVDASGQETALSTDTASTSTIATGASAGSTNSISISSPATATGAVGYRVYMTASGGASLTEILYSPTCTATTLQSVLPSATVCAIGQPATVTAVVTGKATVPLVATAYPRVPGASGSYPPFPALGTIAAAAAGNLATINLPAGYLNTLGKSIELCGNGFATTNSTTGTMTLATKLASLVGTTSITPFTAVSGTTTGSATVPFNFCETWTTSATGATGTLEAHGWVTYGLAGTAPGTQAQDIIILPSSTVDLTKADQIQFILTPATTGFTAAQLRQLNLFPTN